MASLSSIALSVGLAGTALEYLALATIIGGLMVPGLLALFPIGILTGGRREE